MNEFDDNLRSSLAENGAFDAGKASELRKIAIGKFEAALKKVERTAMGYVLVLSPLAVFCAVRSLNAPDTRDMLLYAIVFLVALEKLLVVRFWYWVTNNKISVLKEVKLLRMEMHGAPPAGEHPGAFDVGEDITKPVWGGRRVIAFKIALIIVCILAALLAAGPHPRYRARSQPTERPRQYSSASGFAGNINAVSADREAVVLIVPTHEADKDVQERIHEYVQQIRERFFKGAPILTDEDALKRDLSSNALFVYGTPTGNHWLAQFWDELPLRIEPNKIVAREVHTGTDLRCITAWPNPQNPQRGVAIYTAQRAEDIVGINKVFHGPTDYVIARDTEVLENDFYDMRDGQWSLSSHEPEDVQAAEPAAEAVPIDVSVDPRVELISIIFRLAGNSEYNQCRVPSYDRDVEQHFGPYKDHPVVQIAAELKRRRGVSVDAPTPATQGNTVSVDVRVDV